MEDDKNIFQRYGGHLVLVVVVALLFLAVRSVAIGDFLAFGLEDESDLTASPDLTRREPRVLDPDEFVPQPAVDMSEVPILIDYSLSPALNPFTYEGKRPEHTFITYTVEPLDTPIGIAEKFEIDPETLLGGNPFLSEESGALQAGTVLIIMPLDGLIHDVGEGENLEGLAQQYGVPVEDIIAYEANNLEFPFRLYPGTQILVPGAVREVFVWTAPSLPSRPSTSDSTGSGVSPLIQGTGTFIWPVGYRRLSQNYWYGHQAIDISVPSNNVVVASDTGTVTWAGWNVYGYGNLVVINHGNGYETYYAHLNNVSVQPGQIVYQGNPVGLSGSTGRSSGPHLHFEIRYFNTLLQPLGYLN